MKIFWLILTITLLSACAHQTQAPVITDTQQYQQQLSHLGSWQLDGKIAVQRTNKSDSAAVHWEQEKARFDIFLSGPLGAGATRLTGTPELMLIYDADGEHSTTSNLQQLIEQRLGWTFPVEKLPQWVLGLTDNPQAKFNPDHTLASFEQDGWQVHYLSYQTVDQWLLPERILLQHADMRVTLVIKSWDVP